MMCQRSCLADLKLYTYDNWLLSGEPVLWFHIAHTRHVRRIVQAVMVDAVLAGDGWCYERTAMEQWLQTEDTSPKTGAVLPHKRLVPNITVRKLIALYLQQPPQ